MRAGFVYSHFLLTRRCWRPTRYVSLCRALVFALSFLAVALVELPASPPAAAQGQATQAAGDNLVKFVILSRHGVRAPIPKQDELDRWTTNQTPWPAWYCGGGPDYMKACDRGQLTPKGRTLARQMGTYYKKYLDMLLPQNCPADDQVFFWADLDERTKSTSIALLHGFRPNCDIARYFHTTSKPTDRIFHPVDGANCKLDVKAAENAILSRVPNRDLTAYVTNSLGAERTIAQSSLKCCKQALCNNICGSSAATCTLPGLPTCLAPEADKLPLGGGLRIASTFAELLLLEYANGFPSKHVGWGIARDQMIQTFRLHTAAFDLEQRTPYIAKLQGSRLLRKVVLALQGVYDQKEGSAPANAKFVAYVGHDTNIANVAAMLGLSWEQKPDYQRDQTPPAGALVFELHSILGSRFVFAWYVAQSLEEMRSANGKRPVLTRVPIPGCGNGDLCALDEFVKLVEQALDSDCSQ